LGKSGESEEQEKEREKKDRGKDRLRYACKRLSNAGFIAGAVHSAHSLEWLCH
jgi:hypothetical protein